MELYKYPKFICQNNLRPRKKFNLFLIKFAQNKKSNYKPKTLYRNKYSVINRKDIKNSFDHDIFLSICKKDKFEQ
jgi:hypothetical protein